MKLRIWLNKLLSKQLSKNNLTQTSTKHLKLWPEELEITITSINEEISYWCGKTTLDKKRTLSTLSELSLEKLWEWKFSRESDWLLERISWTKMQIERWATSSILSKIISLENQWSHGERTHTLCVSRAWSIWNKTMLILSILMTRECLKLLELNMRELRESSSLKSSEMLIIHSLKWLKYWNNWELDKNVSIQTYNLWSREKQWENGSRGHR